MRASLEVILAGGGPRSLGRAAEVVRLALTDPRRLHELFGGVLHRDEIVRMRAGDALEKVCRDRPELLQPYVERLLAEASEVGQPSVQWHLAQMLGELALRPDQQARTVRLLKRNLDESTDWIVITCTLETLATFAAGDRALRRDLIGRLQRYRRENRKSIAKRAEKLLARLRALGGDPSDFAGGCRRRRPDPGPAPLQHGDPQFRLPRQSRYR